MFKCRLFVIHKFMVTCMIGFYVNKSFSLNIGCIETVQINNQSILHFANLWSKLVPTNIIYRSIVNSLDDYLDLKASTSSIRYIIRRDKQIKYKNKKLNRSQGGYFHRP